MEIQRTSLSSSRVCTINHFYAKLINFIHDGSLLKEFSEEDYRSICYFREDIACFANPSPVLRINISPAGKKRERPGKLIRVYRPVKRGSMDPQALPKIEVYSISSTSITAPVETCVLYEI